MLGNLRVRCHLLAPTVPYAGDANVHADPDHHDRRSRTDRRRLASFVAAAAVFRLPPGYAPPDLVPVSPAGIAGGGRVRAIVVADHEAMVDRADAEGTPWWFARPTGRRPASGRCSPAGFNDRTCYAAEPWHFRWVGRGHAAAATASELTLREWLWSASDDETDPGPLRMRHHFTARPTGS